MKSHASIPARRPKAAPRAALGCLALGLSLALSPALLAAEAPAPAAAADPTMVEIVNLNKKAIGAYRAGKAQAAMDDLLAAAKLAESHGLGTHDVMARTQIHLGIVAIAGLKDRFRGLAHFGRALAIRPDIQLTASLATPALKKDLKTGRKWIPQPTTAAADAAGASDAKAKEQAKEPAKEQAKDPPRAQARASDNPHEPPLPQAIPQPLYCPTPDLGPPNEPVPLFCVTQPDVHVGKITAYFRPAGGDLYTAVPMGRKPSGWMTAMVPAQAVRGRSLQVYFEAQDGAGNVAANNGKDEMPNIILLKEGAPHVNPRKLAFIEVGAPPAPAGDEATPLELRERAAEKAASESPVLQGRPRRPDGSFFLGLGLGGGYGWHGDLPLERHAGRQVGTGYSPAGLGYFAPEIGYQVTPRLALSLQTRHQYLPASGSGDAEVTRAPPQIAHAALLRLQYAMADIGDLQIIGSLAIGGGSALRMQVAPNRRSGLASSDTVVAGPGAAGPGLGLAYNFSKKFVLGAEARALAGFPAFAVLMEGTGSLQYTF
jgi:hypothetical protein